MSQVSRTVFDMFVKVCWMCYMGLGKMRCPPLLFKPHASSCHLDGSLKFSKFQNRIIFRFHLRGSYRIWNTLSQFMLEFQNPLGNKE